MIVTQHPVRKGPEPPACLTPGSSAAWSPTLETCLDAGAEGRRSEPLRPMRRQPCSLTDRLSCQRAYNPITRHSSIDRLDVWRVMGPRAPQCANGRFAAHACLPMGQTAGVRVPSVSRLERVPSVSRFERVPSVSRFERVPDSGRSECGVSRFERLPGSVALTDGVSRLEGVPGVGRWSARAGRRSRLQSVGRSRTGAGRRRGAPKIPADPASTPTAPAQRSGCVPTAVCLAGPRTDGAARRRVCAALLFPVASYVFSLGAEALPIF